MKLLIHTINGVGLGHLIRTVEIAKALISIRRDLNIVFVTNSKFPEIIKKEGFRFCQLKKDTKEVLDKKISYKNYLKYNEKEIKKIIENEYPDLILFDCELNSSLINFCIKNKIKTSFVLRNPTSEKFNKIIEDRILEKIDLVLIPHSEQDIEKEYLVKLKKYNNVKFINPIIKNIKLEKEIRNENNFLRVLITFSAGANINYNRDLFDKVSEFLEYLKNNNLKIKNKKIKLSIITGPYFDENSCNLHGFPFKKFEYNFLNKISESDIIVCPAGYNIINEIIYIKKPALVIPIQTKQDTQFSRAQNLEKKGCVRVVEDSIKKVLEEIIEGDNLLKMKNNFPEIVVGNKKAAIELNKLLESKQKIAVLRSDWLPFSERFIFDELNSLEFHIPYIFCIHDDFKFKSEPKLFYRKVFEQFWTKEFPFIKKKQIKLYNKFVRWCSEKIKINNIKLLHTQFLTDALFFLKIKQLTKLPLIVSVRGYDLYSFKNINLSKLFKEADFFLVRSKKMKEDLIKKGCNPEKIIIHHSGIRLNKEELIKNPYKNIGLLMVGRLVEKKGTLFGIDIFNELCKKYKNLSLTIIGDGPLKEKVLEKIKKSSFSDKIKILEELPNFQVLEIMKKNHILLQPSLTAVNGDKEGIPNSIMEAMSLGLVVVASDNGSTSEIVEDKKTGFIFKENNINEAINKISFVIDNINKFDKIKAAALNKVKNNFNIIKQTKKLEIMYDNLLKKRKDFNRYFQNYNMIRDHDIPSYFRADIHPIRGCDSHCIMCDNWKNEKKEFFSFDRIKKLITELKKTGIKEIRFHGQEPTLFKKLPKLIDYAKELGLFIGLKTNCNNLTEEYCKKINKVDKLYFSIDSPKEGMHNKLRGNINSYKNNLNAIKYLRNFSKNIIIESNSVITKLNYKSLVNMPEFAADNQIDKISFVLLNEKNKKNVSNLHLNKKKLEEFFFKITPKIIEKCINYDINFDFSPFFTDLVLENPLKVLYELEYNSSKFDEEINNFVNMDYGKKFYEKHGCYSPLDHVSINYNGKVYPCCVVERLNKNAVGNVLDSSFEEIWNNSAYNESRRKTIRTNGKSCRYPNKCASNFEIRKALDKEIKLLQEKDEAEALKSLKKIDDLFFKDRSIIDEQKTLKLKQVISFSLDKIPFYKKKLIKNSENNIFSFNFTKKKEVRDNIYSSMINDDYLENPNLVLDRTSGSMDETVPFAYLRGFERYIKMIYPFMINSDWKWGEKYFVFTTLHCSRDRCSTEDLPYYVDREKIPTSDNIFTDKKILLKAFSKLNKRENSLIHADPFYLSALTLYLNKTNKKIKLKAISSTYEFLLPTVKKYLEKTFKCKVFDNYGCSEFGSIAFSCEKGNKHIFENSVYVEIFNKGKYIDPEVGEIVVTSLDNYVMPLIRYKTGDLGKFIQEKCSCGRNNKIIEVYGRENNCLKFNDKLYTEKDIAELMDIPGILLYQIIKKDKELLFYILPTEKYNQNFIKKEINNKFKKAGNKINIEFVDSIMPEESGKFTTIKNR